MAELTPEQRQALTAKLSKLMAQRDKAANPEPWYEDMAEGAAASVMETGYGIQDLAGKIGIGGGVTDEGRATLKDWQQDAGESGWGTGGRVLGEIAQFMLPGGAALKGAKLATKAPGLARTLATIGAEGAAAAGLGATKLPNAGSSRMERAVEEGAAGLVGGAAGQLLKKSLQGIARTPEADTLLKEGVYLTPGMVGKSPRWSGFETVMSVVPGLARGTKAARALAEKSYRMKVLGKAATPGAKITEDGSAGLAQVKKSIDDGYSAAWNKTDGLSNSGKNEFVGLWQQSKDAVDTLQKGVMDKIFKEFSDTVADPTPAKIKSLDNFLRKKIKTAKGDYDFREILNGLRGALRKGIGKDADEALKAMDSRYPAWLSAKKAGKAAFNEGGNFTPAQYGSAVKSTIPDAPIKGASDTADFAAAGSQSVGNKLQSMLMDTAKRVSGIVPTPIPLKTVGKGITGQWAGQKALDPLAEALRLYDIAPTAAATALNE